MKRGLKFYILLGSFLALCGNIQADFYIRGFGFLGNQYLSRTVNALLPLDKNDTIREEDLEDMLYIINEEVHSKGYLHPEFAIKGKTICGEKIKTAWKEGLYEEDIANGTEFDWVKIIVKQRKLYYFKTITAECLPEKYNKKLEKYFYVSGISLISRSDRYYTESRLSQGIRRIREDLIADGYRDNIIETKCVHINDETGEVCIELKVDTGNQFRVRSVFIEDECKDETRKVFLGNQIYTRRWLRGYTKNLRDEYFACGHPDVATSTEIVCEDEHEACTDIDIKVLVKPGPQVTINSIRLENHGDTDESIFKGKEDIKPGYLLNPIEVDKYRDRIAGLGIYKSVEVEYVNINEKLRDVVLKCIPYEKLKVHLITGVGTDEILRGGLEITRNNLFGRAHKASAKGIISFTVKEVEGNYTIPEFLQKDTSLFSNIEYGDRDLDEGEKYELLRTSIGVQRHFPNCGLHTALQYSFEKVRSRERRVGQGLGRKKAKSSAIELSLQQNKLDNGLFPTEGYKLYGNFETAIRELGSDVSYFRATMGVSVHHQLHESVILHLGARHGVYAPFRSTDTDIIRAKRFFLGGPTTIRGYKQGEAGPSDILGDAEGSLSYLLGNIEIEHRLLEKFSIFVFFDALGFARDINDYPLSKGIYTVGGGISFQTIIGPLRAGWGHNLNPGHGERQGKYHIALGFPF